MANSTIHILMLWQLFDISIKMFLRDNFIHGDLHAGNLLYDTVSSRITVLDAGLTASLPAVGRPSLPRQRSVSPPACWLCCLIYGRLPCICLRTTNKASCASCEPCVPKIVRQSRMA